MPTLRDCSLASALALAIWGCAPDRQPASPAPPVTTVVVPPLPGAQSAADAKPPAPPAEPAFLSAHVDTLPLRARLVGSGRIGVLADRSDARTFGPGSVERVVPVVEEGERRAEAPVRVLCVEPHYRVAAYVERAALATVAREHAVVVARPPVPDDFDLEAAGVLLAPGTPVERTGPRADAQPVRVRVDGLDASGLMRASSIDEVYVASTAPLASMGDAKLVEIAPKSVTLLDAPGGSPLATVSVHDDIPIALFERGPRRSGHSLVAYRGEGAVAVGWVPTPRLAKSRPAGAYLLGRGGLGLKGIGARARTVPLTSDQRLEAPASGEVVGMVSERDEAICVDGCDTDSPTVELFACATLVHLRARPSPPREAPRP